MFQEERLAAAAGCLVPLSTIIEETIAYTKVWLNGGGHFEYPKYLQQKLPQLYQIKVTFHKSPIQERRAFGAPLLENQYIHFRLAELHTEVKN